MTTKPIVVATDGSAHAMRAVEWAAREAALRGAPLRIVSASGMLPRMRVPARTADTETVAAHLSRDRDQALARAASAAAAAAPGLTVAVAAVDGPPALAVSRSGSGALLLVVGSHDGGPITAMALGSVSRYAVAHAACPVVVVREATAVTRRPVVVGIRVLEDCGAALAFAFAEARLRKAPLRAVYARPPGDPGAADTQAIELDDLLNDWRGKYPDVDATQDVVRGHPARVLADQSAEASLVVLGRHDTSGWLVPGPARAVHAVVSRAHGPVAIVPPQAA